MGKTEPDQLAAVACNETALWLIYLYEKLYNIITVDFILLSIIAIIFFFSHLILIIYATRSRVRV